MHSRQERPYNHDSTASSLLSEVKHDLARLVLRWGTTLESLVLFLLSNFHFAFISVFIVLFVKLHFALFQYSYYTKDASLQTYSPQRAAFGRINVHNFGTSTWSSADLCTVVKNSWWRQGGGQSFKNSSLERTGISPVYRWMYTQF